MPDVFVPEGPDGLAMLKLRRMTSLSPVFQARESLSESALYDRCFYKMTPPREPAPCYVIDLNSGNDMIIAGGAQNYLIPAGALFLGIELAPKNTGWTDNDNRLEIVDTCSRIRKDISDLAGKDDPGSVDGTDHVLVRESLLIGIEETPPDERKSDNWWFLAYFAFNWGSGQA